MVSAMGISINIWHDHFMILPHTHMSKNYRNTDHLHLNSLDKIVHTEQRWKWKVLIGILPITQIPSQYTSQIIEDVTTVKKFVTERQFVFFFFPPY